MMMGVKWPAPKLRPKDRAQQRASGQAKADVPTRRAGAFDAQALPLHRDMARRDLLGLALVGRGGHDQAVDEDAVRSDAVAGGLGHDALRRWQSGPLGGIRGCHLRRA